MKALYAPARLNDQLRFKNWDAKTTIKESSFGSVIPQAHDIARRAIGKLARQKTMWGLMYFSAAHLQIVEREISDALQLHMAGLSMPPKYKYTITVKKHNDFVTACIVSEKES